MKFYRYFKIFTMDLDGDKRYYGAPATAAKRISGSEIEATILARKGSEDRTFTDSETMKYGIEEVIVAVSEVAMHIHSLGYSRKTLEESYKLCDYLEDMGYTDERAHEIELQIKAIEEYEEV